MLVLCIVIGSFDVNCCCCFLPALYMVNIEVALVTLKKLKLKSMSATILSNQAMWL